MGFRFNAKNAYLVFQKYKMIFTNFNISPKHAIENYLQKSEYPSPGTLRLHYQTNILISIFVK